MRAISLASRPSTRPSASTRCQARVMSDCFGEKVPPPDSAGPGAARARSAAAALEVLTDRALDPIVEMVLTVRAGAYEAHSADGSVRFARRVEGTGWRYDVLDVAGRNPL